MAGTLAVNAGSSFFNATSAFMPSPADLLMAFPRLVRRASTFLVYLPDQFDGFFSMARNSGSIIADATSTTASLNKTIVTSLPSVIAQTLSQISDDPSATSAPELGFAATLAQGFSLQRLNHLDGIFSYIASRWAVSTFLIAIILNRAHVYASSRRHLILTWQSRLLLRIVPIALFIFQVQAVLQAMRCQTGTILFQNEENSNRILNGDLTHDGGPLHALSSRLLFWQTEKDSCLRSGMIPPDGQRFNVYGSASVLWPLFMSLCISHFMETISCALQGRQPMAETGMTIFEHSLAFAEAEAVVRSSVGLGLFGLPKFTTPSSTIQSTPAATSAVTSPKVVITRAMILQRLNVPPEVLLIALISSMSHLSSHVLGVVGLQSRFRLVNTGIWGCCFMVAFGWSFSKFAQSASENDIGVLRYPTVCIIGFIPHLMIIAGTLLCGAIYVFAILLTVLSPPTRSHAQGSLWQRFMMAHNNLQANASLSNIRITWEDEFYTTLLKVGFTVLTAASEAVYFNEGSIVTVSPRTWLEEKRFDEFVESKRVSEKLRAEVPAEIQGGVIAEGLGMMSIDSFPPNIGVPIVSGYRWERKTTKPGTLAGAAAMKEEGAGGSQRSGRWYLSLKLVKQVSQLTLCCSARVAVASLQRLGIDRPPNWLHVFATLPVNRTTETAAKKETSKSLEFWMLNEDGTLALPSDTNIDVEYETRKRLLRSDGPQDGSEQAIDTKLYGWWKSGGWWGEVDSSGDYQPSEDDSASVVSTADTDISSAWESDSASDTGRRTPTQAEYDRSHPATSPEESSLAHLANLLDPKTLEHREEARLLAQRLQRDRPMTRAEYRTIVDRERLRLLAPSLDVEASRQKTSMSADEEERLLERIILSRRRQQQQPNHRGTAKPATWTEGAEGMGEGGPQCVVCHSNPRTILVWPCRCLSLCEECRVQLAMNNFGSCVCCRRDVVAFSRLFVP